MAELTHAEMMDVWATEMAKQMAEEIDRDILVDIKAELKRQEDALVVFFCLVGPARAAVLGDMALDDLEWPEFVEPPVQRMFTARWTWS
jgi:hypothetical protein